MDSYRGTGQVGSNFTLRPDDNMSALPDGLDDPRLIGEEQPARPEPQILPSHCDDLQLDQEAQMEPKQWNTQLTYKTNSKKRTR